MLYLIVFAGGVAVGAIITEILVYHNTTHGYFKLEPYDDDNTGFYKVNIRIPSNVDLLKKDRIILNKEYSQK